jgi:hypothetical protein
VVGKGVKRGGKILVRKDGDLIQVIEVGAWQRMVVDSESEVGIVGSLPQPHIVEGIQSCC